MKELKVYIKEELDKDMFYLLDIWFLAHDNEIKQFKDIIQKCKNDKITNIKKLEEYIKGTFLETEIVAFINFINNEVFGDENENYLYSLKRLIDTIIFDKNNRYLN